MLIAAHGNSLRALVKYLDNVSDEEIVELNIPTGIPLVYLLNDDLKPLQTVTTWAIRRRRRPRQRRSRTRAKSGRNEAPTAQRRTRRSASCILSRISD